MSDQQSFEDVYWAHFPPEVRALRVMDGGLARQQRASELAIKGFQIDVPIMAWGWDPLKVMTLRRQFGYTWVPSAMMPPVQLAPGLALPGMLPYDAEHPPSGAIKVSTDAADYPAFDPPPPAITPVAATAVVGPRSIGKIYLAFPNQLNDGDEVIDTRGVFRLHKVQYFGGTYSTWFELVSPPAPLPA